jgi:anti-sigma B factor antagonist
LDNPYLRIQAGELHGYPLLEIAGDVDLSTLPHLQRSLDHALSKETQALILDLRRVTFIDSSGVGALIGVKKRLMTHHGELYLICGDDHVRRKLGLMRLGNIMCLHSTPEDVIRHLDPEMPTST